MVERVALATPTLRAMVATAAMVATVGLVQQAVQAETVEVQSDSASARPRAATVATVATPG
jgi:hypothetical protein